MYVHGSLMHFLNSHTPWRVFNKAHLGSKQLNPYRVPEPNLIKIPHIKSNGLAHMGHLTKLKSYNAYRVSTKLKSYNPHKVFNKTEISHDLCRVPDKTEISNGNGGTLVSSSLINTTRWLGLKMGHKTNLASKNPLRNQG